MSEAEAVEMFVANNLEPYVSNLNPLEAESQQWRRERLWNEGCDNIFKAFSSLFTYLFNAFGGTHKKPGQRHFMTSDEFENLINQSCLVNDQLNQRDIVMHFNLAMTIQVNEIESERHLQATYIEYIEALGRVLDAASLEAQDSQLSPAQRLVIPLHIKIENAIPYFLSYATPKAFQDKFERPKKDEKVGLYLLPNKKYF